VSCYPVRSPGTWRDQHDGKCGGGNNLEIMMRVRSGISDGDKLLNQNYAIKDNAKSEI
jgi:hypothetical protein